MRLVVAITGATGSIYAVNLLKALKRKNIEVHLVVSKWALKTLKIETGLQIEDLRSYASYIYDETDMDASISSGSFHHQGMIILPCSMKTLSGIANGFSYNLIIRAADVTLKEKRKLILVPRETPLNSIHLENMLVLAKMGVSIIPPIPAFYYNPKTIDELVNHLVAKVLDQLGLQQNLIPEWGIKLDK
ncbi:UbiX family flavin prenyltransferase [Clostridium sp. MT-14]|uniref:UbiX family flavin prenyltransferase n=1 Tax=Clostridium sp. MT-14 TaxID=3348360 RepID=UPI0035F32056